jgi:hypothetical protein
VHDDCGVLFADFPLQGQPPQQDATDPIVSCPELVDTASITHHCRLAQLASLGVGCLSREPRTRPALPSIGCPYVSASPEWSLPWRNFFHARLLVTPKPPPFLPPRQLGFQSAGCSMHLSNKRACMLSLDWSPCGWLSTPATLPLKITAAAHLTASTTCYLEQRLEQHLAASPLAESMVAYRQVTLTMTAHRWR